MEFTGTAAKTQRMRLGGPLKILLVVENAQLLERMREVVEAFAGLRLAGAFTTAAGAIDWLVWDREGWHLAYVDLGLREGGSNELIPYLLRQPRHGQVVALGDHLWREVRASCAAMGVGDLLEKGDLIAFQSHLEAKLQ